MKNLDMDETIVINSKQNIKWNTPARQKKIVSDLFLPNFGWSMINKESKKLGASPNIVYAYELNVRWFFPKINGRIINWPKCI